MMCIYLSLLLVYVLTLFPNLTHLTGGGKLFQFFFIYHSMLGLIATVALRAGPGHSGHGLSHNPIAISNCC